MHLQVMYHKIQLIEMDVLAFNMYYFIFQAKIG